MRSASPAAWRPGIIEYLAEGTWTKRLHAGWAAQAGLRAALLGREGFLGPRTVLEGEHGFFRAFGVPGITPDFRFVTEGLGADWQMAKIAFKPYACGTMLHPFIDCAIRLAREGVAAAEVDEVVCRVGEGTVHRLWEPLAEKRKPSTPYSAKFSGPFAIALGLVEQAAGLEQFTEAKVARSRPARARRQGPLRDRSRQRVPAQLHGRGPCACCRTAACAKRSSPICAAGCASRSGTPRSSTKFRANAAYGGWPEGEARRLEAWCERLHEQGDLRDLASFRGS